MQEAKGFQRFRRPVARVFNGDLGDLEEEMGGVEQ